MSVIIRLATRDDAGLWLDLLQNTLGSDYPAKEVYEPDWIASQLDPASGQETWVAEVDGRLHASIATLKPAEINVNPIANLGRNLHLSTSYADGSSEALVRRLVGLAAEHRQMVVVRLPAADNAQQQLYESLGFVCVGFQPLKHILKTRQGILFYVHAVGPGQVTRLPLSESLPQISELATVVLASLEIPYPIQARDGVTGYPLHTELTLHNTTYEDFEVWRQQLHNARHEPEVSTGFNRGCGLLRTTSDAPVRAILGQRESGIVGGLGYIHDEHDRCVRILDAFSTDELSIGRLFQQVDKIATEQLNAAYLEVDILMTAPRLLKSAEQLGFAPVAYLPAFFNQDGLCTDVVKLVKLNMTYDTEYTALTDSAAAIVGTIDQNFEYYKTGQAMVNLLRGLSVFDGLGDGELRKITRLFSQKLYRPGEPLFQKGEAGEQAFVVMRGQVDIYLNDPEHPVARMQSGQILGELAFLENAPRSATAVASQASIVLVLHRAAFNDLAQKEPHLGLSVMRNVALDLSHKLRRTSSARSAK